MGDTVTGAKFELKGRIYQRKVPPNGVQYARYHAIKAQPLI